jgi:hypothetical protein
MTGNDETDFDWDSTDGEIIIAPVRAVAIYSNPRGDVVIRQESTTGNHLQDDPFIALPLDQAEILAKRLAAFVKKAKAEAKA